MSENRQNRHSVSIPADWDLPKFSLAKRVQTTTVLPDTTRIQTGEILGLERIKADSLWVTNHGATPGWYYSIQVDANDPWYAIDPVICANESDISELTAVP